MIFNHSVIVLQRPERPRAFCSVFTKEILSIIQFLITAKLFSDVWFLFSILLRIVLRKAMLDLVNTLTSKKKTRIKVNIYRNS